ncbi:MAG: adenylosuccinate lyase family protein [Myxococcota bacterium]|nr:adenylosuccinate lyase family protein [Myxococcota bacterium]
MRTTPFDSKLYSELYGTSEMKAIWDDTSIVQSWLDTEIALAETQAELGLIPAEAAIAIGKHARVDIVDWDSLSAETVRTGMAIKPLVDQVCAQGGDLVERYFHWGTTTQDILDTGQALRLRRSSQLLMKQLSVLLKRLMSMAVTHRLTPMVGRTNAQDAQPTTWGLQVSSYLGEFVRHTTRLLDMKERVCVGMLGGAVGTLASQGERGLEVRNRLMAKLGLTTPKGAWNGSQDAVVELVQLCGLVLGSLARLGNDIACLSRTSIGEVREATGDATSSTMPHKANPRGANMLQAFSRLGAMYAGGALNMMDQVDVRSASMRMTSWSIVPESLLLVSASLERAAELLDTLVVNPHRMLANFGHSRHRVMSEAVMMRLAAKVGRKRAYQMVQRAIQSDSGGELALSDLLLADQEVRGHLDAEAIRDACNPENYLGASGMLVDEAVESAEAVLRSLG